MWTEIANLTSIHHSTIIKTGIMVTLAELAHEIQFNVAVIDDYLKKHNLQQPTFDVDSPKELPPDANVQRARMLLIEKATALANLATGSADDLLWHQMTVSTSTGFI